ncbi:SpaA isopeptide-forming pilin-related protein [Faecalibacterium wellingii]|uniref:Cna B-type domain-containing protein n=1 Tax=Faecalibacterium wellingii TaxID=2929491 RepID=A0ABU3TYY5_9FIRM|nr:MULTISPECIES: SpaA isopeptide-forming pilin-related protein [Faecalibacterium]MDU8688460.1 Cna B-type domain-containing protein [Faecalibacterium prausnitzii]UQK55516.1 Cna B-type domain-containing protein [Faecalibacterium sp. HTF-F]
MKDITTALMQQFRREHKTARRYMALLLALALLTSLFVNWQLHSVGIAQTADYQCGEIEHQHTAECYEKVLVCGYEEGEPEDWNATKPDDSAFPDADYGVEQSEADIAAHSAEPEPEYIFVPHQHTDDCYQEVKTLTCYEEEHVHTDDCFDPEDGSLICDLFEHTHDDSCYSIEYELVCGLEEGELVEEPNPDYVPVDEEASAVFDDAVALQPVVDDSSLDTPVHHHTDACYEEVLVCGLPEHHHTVNCLSDPLADVEDEETWSAKTNVVLTGAWADDLTAVAKSQLGYQQSERNFQLDDEDQTTVRHYTRYGAWYGNAYGAWDVMFLSYCLNYADVPQTMVPQRAGVQALRSDLRGSEWLKAAAEVELVPGDIVFYNSITTETVAVEEDVPQIMDDSADADIALLSLEPAAAEPQTEERTVSTETVGIVSDVDADTGTLTVISGDVDGKVAEVSLRADEITDVIDLAAAHKAQEEGEREEPDGVEPAGDEETSLVIWATGPVSQVSPYAVALLSDEAADDASTAAETVQSLDRHITSVTFQKEIGTGSNTQWTDIPEGETVKDGDTIQLVVEFNLPYGTFPSGSGTMTYQLPGGLKLDKKIETDWIIDAATGKSMGTYSIDTNGLVTMNFTGIGSGAAFDGKLTFKAKADLATAPDGKISFGNNMELQVTKKDPDLSIKKELADYEGKGVSWWSNETSGYYAYWKVTVSSENGSGGPVKISDKITGFPAKHNTTDIPIKLIKQDANNTQTELSVGTEPYQYTVSGDGSELSFAALPELKEGEKYILYYATKAASKELKDACKNNTSSIMYNEAKAETDKVKAVSSGRKQITYNCNIIKKEGKLNADGLIEWTVVVRAPLDGSTDFLKDYTFQDVLPGNITLSGDINVQIEGAQTTYVTMKPEDMKGGVKLSTLDDNAKTAYRFTITYKTTVPTGTNSVENTASVDGIKASDKVTFDQGIWTLTKTHSRTDNNNIAYWDLSAVNVTGADHFELTDTIGNTTDSSGTVLQNKHYAIASELQEAIEKGLTLILTDNRTLNYQQAKDYLTITYLDASNNKVEASDKNTPVLSFTIAVKKAENGGSIAVRQMVLNDVPTHEVRSDKPGNADWTFTNNAKITQDGSTKASDSAEDVYRSSVFEKSVAIDGKRQDYITGDTTVNYDDVKDQKLLYRIRLVTTGTETGNIVITDTMPTGTELTVNGDKLRLYVDNEQCSWNPAERWHVTYDETNKKLTVEVYGCNDGKQHVIELLYEVSFKNDSRWKDLLTSDVVYTNKAEWDGKPAAIKTTVHKNIAPLIKTGKQLKDKNGNWTNNVTYTVIINPAAQKLGTTGTLKLRDEAKIIRGNSFYGHNVRLYYYEHDKYEHDKDVSSLTQVKEGLYHIDAPEPDYWLCMTVPDGVALLLQYDIEFDPGSYTDPKLSNTVQLEGVAQGTAEDVNFKTNESSVQITRGQLVIHKMDAETSKFLPDAEFTIDSYNKNLGEFEKFMSGTTGANGELTFSITSAEQTLSPNVLYRLTETKAPDNYILDSTPKYLFFYEKGADPKEAFKTALGDTPITDHDKTVTVDDVTFGCSTNTTQLTVRNTYNQLTVKKYWLSAVDGRPLAEADIPVKSIQVELYRYTEGETAQDAVLMDTQYLNKDNGWSFTWFGENQIPAADEEGHRYYYLVKEVTNGNWVAEITNNSGIQTGKIFITNKVYSGYVLPSTGGMGTVPFAAVGGMLTVGAALLLAKRKKHEEKGE